MQQRTGLPGTNGNALTELYLRHALTLLSYTRRYLPVKEDAEDILVEVFFAAYERGILVALSEDEQLAWLRRVAYNKCVDFLRRQQRYPNVHLEDVAEMLYASDEQSPERVALRTEAHSLLRTHLAELPTQQQTILHLKFGQGLRNIEIARRLNKSESSVSMVLSRALNHLRGLYRIKKGDHHDE
jgi:RNA polymerase sigma factor (sigma-70 family)